MSIRSIRSFVRLNLVISSERLTPPHQALCHCLNCRKLTGSLYSTAILLPAPALTFNASSPLKKVTVSHHEAGFPMTVTFCADCGSALSKEADTEEFRGMVIVFAGCLDGPEALEDVVPQAEMWTKYRAGWRGSLEGTRQCVGFA